MTTPKIARRTLLAMLLSLPANAAPPLAAVLHKGDRETLVGEVAVDDLGRIKVISANGDRANWLRRLVERMNDKAAMYVEVPAREGSGRYAVASQEVKRGDPAFIPALKDYLRTFYELELRPR